MQHLLQTGLSLRYPFVAAAPQVHAAGDKDFPEHGLHSGDGARVLSMRRFPPNCICADEIHPVFVCGPSGKGEVYRTLVSRFCLKDVLLLVVAILKTENLETLQKVEACSG